MALRDRGLKLRCRDGHFEMASFDLKRENDGFWMWVECDFDGHQGGHWLAPDTATAPNRVRVTEHPYLWPSATDAYSARDRWEAQEDA